MGLSFSHAVWGPNQSHRSTSGNLNQRPEPRGHSGQHPLPRRGRAGGRERREPVGAFRAQDGALGIHVVGRTRSAGEGHLTDHEGVLTQLLDQSPMGDGEPARMFVDDVHGPD